MLLLGREVLLVVEGRAVGCDVVFVIGGETSGKVVL
jgi:hypothetical protein